MNIEIIALILVAIYLFIMLIIVQLKRDNTIGNFTWGGGALLLTLYTFFTRSTFLPRQILVTLLITLWCTRMVIHLYSRYKKEADPRFVAWEKQWGRRYALFFSLGWIVVMNGALLLIMAFPGVLVNSTNIQPPLGLLDIAGYTLWLMGYYFESVGDYQLYVFIKNPANKGKILMEGLWRYTRHPNYFGEISMWWGIWIICLSVPFGWATIIAPAAITILLVFFTGVPMLERVFANNPKYQAYKRRTSVLIPWFVKENN